MVRFVQQITVALVLCQCLGSCGPNPVDPPPNEFPTLAGDYYGWYSWTLYPNSSFAVNNEQRIMWTFTDQTWALRIDATNKTDFCICESSGRYSLEDRVR